MRHIAILTGFLIATITAIGAQGEAVPDAVKVVVRDLAAIPLAQDGAGAAIAARQG
jgi:hypothetical protein